jgi:hypothetical protein
MICANTHRHTGKNDYVLTDGETHRKLVKDRRTLLEADEHQTIKGSRLATVEGIEQLKVGALHLQSGREIVIESGSQIVLKVGDTFIKLNGSGIVEQGPTIWQNCGKSVPASPGQKDRLLPDPPKGADKGSKPNGGEMAKPMPPLNPTPQEGKSEESMESQDQGLVQYQALAQKETMPSLTAIPISDHNPTAQELAEVPAVAAAIEKAWKDSLPYETENPLKQKEQGGWIIRNTDGTIDTIPVEGTNRDYIEMGIPPDNVIGMYHTHPGPASEGYLDPPSESDKENVKNYGIPSIIRGHGGYYYVNP